MNTVILIVLYAVLGTLLGIGGISLFSNTALFFAILAVVVAIDAFARIHG